MRKYIKQYKKKDANKLKGMIFVFIIYNSKRERKKYQEEVK